MRFSLESERLAIRTPRPDDVEFIASLYANREVMRYIGAGTTLERAAVERRLAEIAATRVAAWDGLMIATLKNTDERIGRVGLLSTTIDDVPQVEVGWWLDPEAWGRGFASEAARLLLDYGFDVLALPYIVAIIQPANIRSQAVATRVGLQFDRKTTYRGIAVNIYQGINPTFAKKRSKK